MVKLLKQTPPLFWFGVALMIVGQIDGIAFLIWRWDKPPGNPGGSVGGMGHGVILWEMSGTLLGCSGLMLAGIVAVLQRMRNEQGSDW